ncbi:MAG: ATP-binding protein [bacterium]|nr:ATP-binding protein [bacterium]
MQRLCTDASSLAIQPDNDRSGIGRFGVGMTLAAINQCKRVEVYSRQNGSSWHWTYIDLDEIEESCEASIAAPAAKDVPDQYRDLVGANSGTLVIWSKYDRQPESADSMTEEMRIWFGRTYRRFIWSDFTISLDGTEVHAIDPLYFNWKDTRFPKDPPAQIFDPIKIGWPVGSGSNNESEIVIRMSLVSESLRPNQGSGNSRECRDRYIDRNQGISIMRNDREVFYGPIPYWPGSAWFVEKDRWWGCEISFNAILDRAFTVKNIKRGAVPVKQLKETIYEQIKPTRETVLKEIDRVWDLAKEKKIQETTTSNGLQTGHSVAEQVAKKNPGQKSARPPKSSAQVINEILPGLSEEEKAKWMAKWQSQPFTLHDGSWNGPAFFEVTHLGGSAVIRYNTNHPFIKELYCIQERLGRSQDSNPDAFMIRGFIDLMTIAFAKAEATWEEDTEVRAGQFLQDLELSWGQYLKSYLSDISQGVRRPRMNPVESIDGAIAASGSRSNVLVVQTSEYNGKRLLGVRRWYVDRTSGEWCPTKKGFLFQIRATAFSRPHSKNMMMRSKHGFPRPTPKKTARA